MKTINSNRYGTLVLSALFVLLLAGCSSTDTEMTQNLTAEPATPPEPVAEPVDTGPSPEELEAQRLREEMLSITVYYFDFDKSELLTEAMEPLRYHAQQLQENPAMTVRLEGHADERGTSEYNLALGERRARAVQQFLLANGVGAGQMEVISYGEERPAANGTGEESWSRNRRVELKY